MPLTERDYDLAAEYDRLDEEVEATGAEFADDENADGYRQRVAGEGTRAQKQRAGLAWALDYPDEPDVGGSGWDADSVTLAALTAGEEHLVNETVDETGCSNTAAFVAAATVDAPYVEPDHKASDAAFRATVENVNDLHPGFVTWAEDQAEALGRVGDTGKSFMESVLEAAASTTSPETNG